MPNSELELLLEERRIGALLVAMLNAIDEKRWKDTESAFAEEVYVDYSSLNQQPGASLAAAKLVSGWKAVLEPVKTHHMLTNLSFKIDDDTAEVYGHVYGSHEVPGKDDYWDVYGRYHFKLQRNDSAWKIVHMALHVHGQRGDPALLAG